MTGLASDHSHPQMASPDCTDERPLPTQTTPRKSIFVFCDGTGKDGTKAIKAKQTNIYRLFKLVKEAGFQDQSGRSVGPDGRVKLTFYVPGIGAGSLLNLGNILARVFGATIVESIVKTYFLIAENYIEGDIIYLFGYSRGAFVARKVASLIYRVGLGVKDREALMKRWSQYEKPVPWNLPPTENAGAHVRIRYLVAWDTVAAVFKKPCVPEKNLMGMPDEELPPNVEHALHAMAFHENRRFFRATLFDNKDNKTTKKLKEVWFPGAHADVGGGDDESPTTLPNISLLWVIGEMARFMKVITEGIEYPDLNTVTPTDAYERTSTARRALDSCETRLESKLLRENSLIHESVAHLRNFPASSLDPRPKKPSRLLTIGDLTSINWNIKAYLVACNTLEALIRSESVNKRMNRIRTRVSSSIRSSVANLPGRTPRPSNAPLPPTTLRETTTPRVHSSSFSLPQTRQDMQAPEIRAPTSSSRHRGDSTASRRPADVATPGQATDLNTPTQPVDSTVPRQQAGSTASCRPTDSVASRRPTESVASRRPTESAVSRQPTAPDASRQQPDSLGSHQRADSTVSRHRSGSTASRQRNDSSMSRQRIDSGVFYQRTESTGSRSRTESGLSCLKADSIASRLHSVPEELVPWSQLAGPWGSSQLAPPPSERSRRVSTRLKQAPIYMPAPPVPVPTNFERTSRHHSRAGSRIAVPI